jgi:flagellar biosynthesis/type III secretory pathway M-ring protein FliF/YscJ
MTDGWLFTRIIGWAAALVFVLYVVFGVVLPWWREQQRPGRDQELEEQLERLRARHRQREAAGQEGTERDSAEDASAHCD